VLAAYVSGHGFGHATRTGEVLRELASRPGAPSVSVASSAPEALFRAALGDGFEYRKLECDVGVAQRDALTLDERGTLARWREHAAGLEAQVDAEARWLAGRGARVVLGDVPPLAFLAAARAGLPSVALANFSWDWIYRHLARVVPELAHAADAAADAYATCGLLLRLPFAGEMGAFPTRADVPLVARRPRLGRGEARRRLGLGGGPAVLVSFGGIGMPGPEPSVLGRIAAFEFVLFEPEGPLPGNVRGTSAAELARRGLGYADLVGAVDVVVTKPGYGIVSDAIGAGTRLVYTERGDFPEYPIMVREMAAYLPCAHVSNRDLFAGRLEPALGEVLRAATPRAPDRGGAARVAERLLELAG
jgi:L-arabinokinase